MRFLVFLLIIFVLPAVAAELPQSTLPAIVQPKAPVVEAPTIAIPAPSLSQPGKAGKLTVAQKLKVEMRVPQVKKAIADLSVEEQRAVLRKAAPPRQKLSDAERGLRSKAARDAWTAKTPAMRAELRQKQLAAWQKLPADDRAYRRERMQEQLMALPEDDRKIIIAPFITKNDAKAP